MSADLTTTMNGSLLTLEATLAMVQASLDAGGSPAGMIRAAWQAMNNLGERTRSLSEPSGTIVPALLRAAADHLDRATYDLHRTPYHVQQARLNIKEAIRIMADGASLVAPTVV